MQAELPLARATDPETSHEAAQRVAPAKDELRRAIRAVVAAYPCSTQEEIAELVQDRWGTRWKWSTIISACNPKRSGLELCDKELWQEVTNDEGRVIGHLGTYSLPAYVVDTKPL